MDITELKRILANNILKYMDSLNLDRQDVSERLGIKYSTFCDWVQPNHPSYPKMDKLQRIADILHVNVINLIQENSEEPLELVISKVLEYFDFIPVLGKVPAGVPFEAIETLSPCTYELIPKNLTKGNKVYYALLLEGDSMEPNYGNGEIVTFLKTPTCKSGDDCCVRINGEDATFKRVTILEDGILLSPLNSENSSGYSPQFYSREQIENLPVEIVGVAIGSRNYK